MNKNPSHTNEIGVCILVIRGPEKGFKGHRGGLCSQLNAMDKRPKVPLYCGKMRPLHFLVLLP